MILLLSFSCFLSTPSFIIVLFFHPLSLSSPSSFLSVPSNGPRPSSSLLCSPPLIFFPFPQLFHLLLLFFPSPFHLLPYSTFSTLLPSHQSLLSSTSPQLLLFSPAPLSPSPSSHIFSSPSSCYPPSHFISPSLPSFSPFPPPFNALCTPSPPFSSPCTSSFHLVPPSFSLLSPTPFIPPSYSSPHLSPHSPQLHLLSISF